MFVAVDDTDSLRGNCTTYLATEIIYEMVVNQKMDLIGFPKLVRLNPAVPWKTRGNGSLVLSFGKGTGSKLFIGEINNQKIFCFEKKTEWEPDKKLVLDSVRPLVDLFHDPVDSDPGLLISEIKPSYDFYQKGVKRIVGRESIENEIKKINGLKYEIGCGRGLIGCVCGMAWIPNDYTYELLTYRPQDRWGTKRIFDKESVKKADTELTTTFNSFEYKTEKSAIIPGTPCPVLYGFRGDDVSDLITGHGIIKTESQSRWIVFKTNQGTDDHIISDFSSEEFIANSSYKVKGTVLKTERIRGGHTFVTIDSDFGKIVCAAYAPSCEFRFVLDWLSKGDEIEVLGELRENPSTLNIEKLHVLVVAEEYQKISNPICSECNKAMTSIGKNKGYRCKNCSTKSDNPVLEKKMRWIVPGWYEPPVTARRHLSKPLKRMGILQPLEFVNCRN